MDLNLFHDQDRLDMNYNEMDRTISRSGSICYLLEWSCWYDRTVALRLLGHYRLFHLCKSILETKYTKIPPENSYIRFYRENRVLPHSWVSLIPFRNLLVNRDKYPEIKSINHSLLFKRPDILHNFLVAAQNDFDKALIDALDQISDPTFLSELLLTNVHLEITENHQHNSTLTNNVHLEVTENHQHNTSLSKNEFHIHPEIKKEAPPHKPAKGKEEGVFSKKQILIILDLLATAKAIEPLDLKKTNRLPAIAELLYALTHHDEESWHTELKKYSGQSLYKWDLDRDGQRMELIRILINLAEKFRNAGLKTVAKLADQKIRELERAAP